MRRRISAGTIYLYVFIPYHFLRPSRGEDSAVTENANLFVSLILLNRFSAQRGTGA